MDTTNIRYVIFSGIPKTGASRCGVEIRGAVKGCGEVRRGAVLE